MPHGPMPLLPSFPHCAAACVCTHYYRVLPFALPRTLGDPTWGDMPSSLCYPCLYILPLPSVALFGESGGPCGACLPHLPHRLPFSCLLLFPRSLPWLDHSAAVLQTWEVQRVPFCLFLLDGAVSRGRVWLLPPSYARTGAVPW